MFYFRFIRGGAPAYVLDIEEDALQAHTHKLNDPGHTHSDEGHTHTDGGHTHGVTDNGHSHSVHHPNRADSGSSVGNN